MNYEKKTAVQCANVTSACAIESHPHNILPSTSLVQPLWEVRMRVKAGGRTHVGLPTAAFHSCSHQRVHACSDQQQRNVNFSASVRVSTSIRACAYPVTPRSAQKSRHSYQRSTSAYLHGGTYCSSIDCSVYTCISPEKPRSGQSELCGGKHKLNSRRVMALTILAHSHDHVYKT